MIAKAPPDGYTLGMIVGSFMTNAAVSANLPYDSAKDFTPLGMVAMQPMALVANKNFPANTIPELVARRQAKSRWAAIHLAWAAQFGASHRRAARSARRHQAATHLL